MSEQVFEDRRLDCRANVTFTGPGDATCPECGRKLYMTADGLVGCYPSENSSTERYGKRRPD
jgi:hypothetical protein